MPTRRDILKALGLAPVAVIASKLPKPDPLPKTRWKHIPVSPPARWIGSLGPVREYDGVRYQSEDEFLHEANEVLCCDCDWSQPLYYDKDGSPVYDTGWITLPVDRRE